jgi:hypothetical protein
MPNKRDVLSSLTREELLSVATRFEIVVDGRARKDDLVDTLVASRRVALLDALPDLPRDRLRSSAASSAWTTAAARRRCSRRGSRAGDR